VTIDPPGAGAASVPAIADLLAAAAAAGSGAVSRELAADLRDGAALAKRTHASSTLRAYADDLAALQAYLVDRGQSDRLPVDPLLLVAFISSESRPDERPGRERAARAVSTIEGRLAGIARAHQVAGLVDPTKDDLVRKAMGGIRRRLGTSPRHAKQELELEQLDHMLAAIPPTDHVGRRDRALLLVGIAAALRRSELVALNVADVKYVAEGMEVTIRSSKTDQEGKAQVLAVALGDRPELCAVRALQVWTSGAGIHDGPIFRRIRVGDHVGTQHLSDRAVALIVKRRAERIGLDPRVFAGHSLRSGGITAAAREDHSERELANLSRHRDMAVLRGYVRRADSFDDVAQVLTSRRRPER